MSRTNLYPVAIAALGVASLFSATGCEGRAGLASEPGALSATASLLGQEKAVVEIDLSAGAPEIDEQQLVPRPPRNTYLGLVRLLAKLPADDSAAGVYLHTSGGGLNWAQTEEVVRLLRAVRDAKKPVVCHSHELGNSASWLFLAGCDRIWMSPAGGMDTVGLAGQSMYLKGALDRLKVRADFLSVGKFKSAVEMFTREGPSDPAREALLEVLGSIRETWLAGVTTSGIPDAANSVEHGPYPVEEAQKLGLVHAIGYDVDARNDAKQRAGVKELRSSFGPGSEHAKPSLSELVRILSGADERSGGRPHVAIVPAIGAIGMSQGGPLESGGIAAKTLTKQLRKIREDDSVKAVVLRIDSPGGSALASDLLWRELMKLRKKKPLVASVGSMAASGGYYMACAAQKIVAPRTSIVGSIGVLGGKIVIGEALHDFGVNLVTFPASQEPGAGRRAGYLSAAETWDDGTREQVRKHMTSIYDLFVKRVAEGRGMKDEQVREHAEGRIFTGLMGQGFGLVDELGGLTEAIAVAKDLAHLPKTTPVTLESGESLLEQLLDSDRLSSRASVASLFAPSQSRSLAAELALLPPEIRSQVLAAAAVAQPLLEGERVLAAAPFVMSVR